MMGRSHVAVNAEARIEPHVSVCHVGLVSPPLIRRVAVGTYALRYRVGDLTTIPPTPTTPRNDLRELGFTCCMDTVHLSHANTQLAQKKQLASNTQPRYLCTPRCPHLAKGKKANNSSANSTSPNTFSLLSSLEARSTAAKIAALRLSVPWQCSATSWRESHVSVS